MNNENINQEIEAVRKSLRELSAAALQMAEKVDPEIIRAGELIAGSLYHGGKLLACGNGGSAADAQHFVAELIGRLGVERRSFPAISLSSDPSVVTALGNDYGYARLFSRQIEGLGQQGDVLLVLSTSGQSKNIIKAVESAQEQGLITIALIGMIGDPQLSSCNSCIRIPASNAQRVQELHMAVLHIICAHVEKQLMESVEVWDLRKFIKVKGNAQQS